MEVENGIKVRGFFRLNIVDPDGTIAGDSGLRENTVTNLGKQHYLAELLGAVAGSSQIGYAALGTGSAPNATHTTQDGELGENVRDAVSKSQNGSTSIVFYGTFASADSFVTATRNLSNIGLWATNTGGSIFSGAAYTSSSCGTNQAVNYTYTITFT
jgi:hypothetical protein